MARVIIEGSSTANGLWDGEAGGWASRLKTAFMADRHNFASVINFSIPLRTADEVARDLPTNLQNYQGNSPARVGLFMLGMSESRMLDGEYALPPLEYRKALGQISVACSQFGFTPVFVGMPPIDESLTRDFGRERATYTQASRETYDRIAADFVSDTGDGVYVDVASHFAERFPDTRDILDSDGLHVNHIGHAALCDLVLPVARRELSRLKSIPPLPSIEAAV